MNSTIFFIKTKIRESSRRTVVNLYFDESHILANEQEKNIETHYKSLVKESYIFESIAHKNSVLDVCLIEVHVLMIDEASSISIANFDKATEKIRQNQLVRRLKRFDFSTITENINFDYASVFLDKYFVKSSNEKSNISFTISSEKPLNQKSNISIN
jgi:hypothetical protein